MAKRVSRRAAITILPVFGVMKPSMRLVKTATSNQLGVNQEILDYLGAASGDAVEIRPLAGARIEVRVIPSTTPRLKKPRASWLSKDDMTGLVARVTNPRWRFFDAKPRNRGDTPWSGPPPSCRSES